MTLPMTLTNLATLDMSKGGYDRTYARVFETNFAIGNTRSTSSNLVKLYGRFANRVLNSAGGDYLATNTQYLGTTRNSDGTYTTVPENIQALLPKSEASEFVRENVQPGVAPANVQQRAVEFHGESHRRFCSVHGWSLLR